MLVGSCFSGIAGLEMGFLEEGCEVAFQVEIEPSCQRTLRKHFPDVKLYTDITEVTYERLARDLGPRANVDVLVGGWPCQDISLAGPRTGLAGERSGLFFEFARLAKEITPRWLVAENVPGLLSSWSPVDPTPSDLPEGRDWQVDETHDLGVVVSTLAELGYVGAWRCLDAQHFGVPQRRRRIFFVCHLGAPFTAPAEVLLERDSSVGDSEESEEAWEADAEAVGDGPDELGPEGWAPDVALPLLSNRQGGQRTTDVEGVTFVAQPVFVGSEYGEALARPLTAVPHGQRFDFETENLLVDPRAYTLHADGSTAMRGDGDAEAAFETEVVRSLDSTGGLAANQGGTVILEELPEEPFTVHSGDDVLWTQGVAQPVIASKGWPGAVTFRKSQRAHNADDCETWEQDEVANTLNAFENHNDRRTTHAIVEAIPIELRMATRTSGATGVGTPGAGFGEEGDPSYPVMRDPPPAVQQELSVRRLTPLECERLQGFPDGWTEGEADSIRYKQLGNAVAVPCSRWIARRLMEVHRRITA